MCGIAGVVSNNCSEDYESLLREMLGVLRHRGPDSAGIFVNNSAGLGHVRLSIIDLNSGDQPIHNEDRSIWIVFNGEIFNYPKLREDLKLKGHRFYTKTDTEVLVHLYEEKGCKLFDDLNGQFAFALWDNNKKTLLLGRDRVGIRPLFYYLKNKRLVFASEIKAIFLDKTITPRLDLQTLSDIFTCWAPLGHLTSFKNVYQVPPGHYALFSSNGLEMHSYWKLPFGETDFEDISLSEHLNKIRELLLDAARIRLRADVQVGAYLSGGIDSTYIASLVKKKFNNLLNTFSVAFTDKKYDETLYQTKAVNSLKTKHSSICCSAEDIGKFFPKVIWHTETPILRTSPAPLLQLSGLVSSNNFKVVLTGEGADEIFAGYNVFKEDRVRRFWARNPESKMRPLLLGKLYPYIFSENGSKAQAFYEGFFKKGLEETDSPVYSHMLRWQNTAKLRTFFSPQLQQETGNIEGFVKRFVSMLPADFMSWHNLSKAQYVESTLFLSNYLLSSQGDRMAMANSIEGRYPFLDHRVIEYACKIPPCYRINGLEEKYILKEAARGMIPAELIKRPKQPYRAPIVQCFVRKPSFDYVEDLLSESSIKNTGYFDYKKVSRLVSKCRNKEGKILSERENMAFVGILSTQLLDHLFLQGNAPYAISIPDNVKVFIA